MSFKSIPPLFFKSFIGFDELFNEIIKINETKTPNYPAFDVVKKGENEYEISLAIAGFHETEIEIIYFNNMLKIRGIKNEKNVQNVIHKGIALRSFEKKFNLNPLVVITEAVLTQGILTIKLFKKIPEVIKPKKIQINIK